mgnify:CR=1 FL=1
MNVTTTVVGSYPRPEWFRDYLRKVEGLQKELDVKVDEEIMKRAISEILDEQKKAGIDLPTDGQLIWHDFLLTIASRLDGFEMNGLVRYFDNNLYYRIPVTKGRIKRSEPILYDFDIAFEIYRDIKAVLSCYTVTKLSKNMFYKKYDEFLWDMCEAIRDEVKRLESMGVKHIQIDEPSLLYAKKDELGLLEDVFKEITKVKMETILMTYFGSAENIFPEVLDFGFDVIGLDFVEGYEENLNVVEEYDIHSINVGIVDGRNTTIEDVKDLKEKFDKIISKGNFKKVYISPNTGLEFLPRVKAYEKMELVVKLKEVIV